MFAHPVTGANNLSVNNCNAVAYYFLKTRFSLKSDSESAKHCLKRVHSRVLLPLSDQARRSTTKDVIMSQQVIQCFHLKLQNQTAANSVTKHGGDTNKWYFRSSEEIVQKVKDSHTVKATRLTGVLGAFLECSGEFTLFSTSLSVTMTVWHTEPAFLYVAKPGGRAVYRHPVVTSTKPLPGNQTRVCMQLLVAC